jgi:CRISPR-associated protein Cmr6
VLREIGYEDITHVGLAYDAWAPLKHGDGKVSTKEDRQKKNPRDEWLKKLAEIKIDKDYKNYFNTWKQSLDDGDTLTATFTLESRLLIGHGEPSAAEVGLKVHHTWGVPVIPGSALKGLLHHYLTITYDDDPNFKGVKWDGSRITKGPGRAIHTLFGGPEVPGKAEKDKEDTDKAAAGFVTFHDALYNPGSAPENQPYAADVLTVHQKSYNDSKGDKSPNDYDSPTPIGFLTVRPGVEFLVALSGPEKLVELAFQKLDDALQEWGVGGKTSAGYGRGQLIQEKSQSLEKFLEWFKCLKDRAKPHQERLDIINEEWLDKLTRLSDKDKKIAFNKIKNKLKRVDLSNLKQQLGIQ